ncbi:MAG: hypothetical protein MUC44_06340 [Beijerinckiaceae bacterium]|jgi:hypothetical protein|nr:hypothetical protein [Beijerinckiaceae bacterium]
MIGAMRNAVVIGMIAYFSPVHDGTPEERLAALKAAPAKAMDDAMRAGPRLAIDAIEGMDASSRDALTRKIAEIALGNARNSPAPAPR